MRIDNKQQLDTLSAATNSSATQRVGQQSSVSGTRSTGVSGSDHASLSSASNLVELAKSASSSSARQAKIASLTQQVQSGSYQGDTEQAGKAMVSELLQKSMSAA